MPHYLNKNKMKLFNQTVTTALTTLSACECLEVDIKVVGTQPVNIFINGVTDSSRSFQVSAETQKFTGFTDLSNVSASTPGGSSLIYYKTYTVPSHPVY